jgi:hypothetical protein
LTIIAYWWTEFPSLMSFPVECEYQTDVSLHFSGQIVQSALYAEHVFSEITHTPLLHNRRLELIVSFREICFNSIFRVCIVPIWFYGIKKLR